MKGGESMDLLDRYRSWQSKRQDRKYITGLRESIATRLESGKQTHEKWERQFAWYDGIIQRDHLKSRDVMESLKLIRDINPDASMAIWNFLRLANQGHELECLKPSGSPYKQGQGILDDLAKRVGHLYGGGADQLINVLNLTGYTQGAIALEVELNEGLNEVVDFHAVDPSTLDFRRNKESGELDLVQKQSDGTYKVLNREQVFYYPIDPDIGDPHGRSPILPVLQIIFFQVEVLRDLKAVAHHQGHARFDISVSEEAIMKNIPQEVTSQGPEAVKKFVFDYIGKIEEGFKNLKPDDNFFHQDSVTVDVKGGTQEKSMDVTRIIDVINQQVVTALKQLPILLGRNEGSTETHGTVQWQIYVAGIESVQRATKRVMEKAYNLSLRVNGVNARSRLTFNKLRTTDRQKEATAALTETNMLIKQVQQGWIDNDEAAISAVGHEAKGEPQTPTIPFRGNRNTRVQKQARSIKTKASRADSDEEDEFVKELETEWADDIARITTQAKNDFQSLLQQQKEIYQERIKEAETPPTRVLLSASTRMNTDRADEPTTDFEDWVKVNILRDSEEQMELWDDKGRDWLEQAAILAGEASLAEIDPGKEFDRTDEQLLEWLSDRSRRDAELIQGTTDRYVIMTLWDVVADGKYSIDKAIEALEEEYAFGESRSETIARTEIISAARAGQFQGDYQSGMVIGKTWHSAHQPNTRDAHAAADGQTVRFEETFIVDGEELMFPGDTSHGASADNTIQCRCFYTRILEEEEDELEEMLSE
ncbi:Phage Mu protein F like protein [Thalassobacillus cyri]|uniref:Phage Mu protein F like protein n=1 Tax=Thalassobacillus cyri TaxID=571932 RepID=A0A1H4BZH3_9BACI|nr:phage minor head protein [Thalassobacillus cyri]SEA53605.1 Phage Mu protein F like protein [Thalassobacillus cyri]